MDLHGLGGLSAHQARKPKIYMSKGLWRVWSFECVDSDLLDKAKAFVRDLNRSQRRTANVTE
jgi:hypothetical protein